MTFEIKKVDKYFMKMSGTLKKKTSLRTVWTVDMENMLLDLWEDKIEELRGSRKNSHVYQEMAATMQDAMQEEGFLATWTDIHTKIDNLTRKYKQEKDKIGPTCGTPSTWEHYNKIHNILGSFRLHNIEICMHENTDLSTLLNETENIIDFDPDSSCSTYTNSDFEVGQGPPTKKRKADVNAELLRLANERIDMQKQQQERKQQVAEIVQRLDTISAQNPKF